MQTIKRTDACRDHPEPFVLAEAILDISLTTIVPWVYVWLASHGACNQLVSNAEPGCIDMLLRVGWQQTFLFDKFDSRIIRQQQIPETQIKRKYGKKGTGVRQRLRERQLTCGR